MKRINELIHKYENGIHIYDRIMDNPKSSNILKNRASYLKGLCESIIDDLKELKTSTNKK